ncbi:MAG: serine/threonine-protein kinase [Kiritimatiellae bacterium]|nr:serine/threonine-protein kinase [Kiritimatiellia bacterium]
MSQDKDNNVNDTPTERIAPEDDLQTTVVVDSNGSAVSFDEPRDDKLFEHYTIYSKIGSGGMGVVYLARDRRLGRFVAIKRLNHMAQSIKSLRQRFLHEARAVAALSHVHIIHIYSLGEDSDGPFIVMEYIAGPDESSAHSPLQAGGLVQPNKPLTLEQYVKDHGQLSTDEAVELMGKISRAVAYAHSCGVIHRDLKPSNILLNKSGEPKIVDFGLARLMRKEEPKITVPGEKLLSIGYGAPEQETDAAMSDERADVYGLGALLYFTITGQNPRYFREQDMPPGVREVAAKALATDKENRWESAGDFADELHKIASRTRVETPTVRTTWRCKWCDSINPMSIKFCAECGWDGAQKCTECGADTFFGVQYCNHCGADARAYESIISLLKKMRQQEQLSRFERVISYADRTHGFEPAGPSGRNILKEISELRLRANNAINKRAQIKEQIPIEIRAENFERAKRFIEQYREMAEDKKAFQSEYQELPGQVLRRDLARATKALQNREWDLAARICDELKATVAIDNAEVLKLRRSINLHYRLVDFRYSLMVLTGVICVYLLTLPVVAQFKKEGFSDFTKIFYSPAEWVYEKSVAAPLFRRYALLWVGDRSMASYFEDHGAEGGEDKRAIVENPVELEAQKAKYQAQLSALYEQQRQFLRVWPVEYKRELESLLDKYQRAGDYDGWEIIQNELIRFERDGSVITTEFREPIEFALLVKKYLTLLKDQKLLHSRNLVKECKIYINVLSDMKKKYTQEGRIEFASMANSEIDRAKTAQHYVDAEAVVAGSDRIVSTERPRDVLLASKGDPRVGEITEMRKRYESSIEQATVSHTERISAWPEEYLNRLANLRDDFQRAGDYDGWDQVSNEISRFEMDLEIAPEHLQLYLQPLATLQNEFRLKKERYKRDFADAVVSSTESYLSELQEFQKSLTVGGKMQEAAEVNSEIKRIRALVAYIDAKKAVTFQGPPVPPTEKTDAQPVEQTPPAKEPPAKEPPAKEPPAKEPPAKEPEPEKAPATA